MGMSHIGITLIITIFAITLYQTNTLLNGHLKYQRVSLATINDPATGATQHAVTFDSGIMHSLKTSGHTKENPCNNF